MAYTPRATPTSVVANAATSTVKGTRKRTGPDGANKPRRMRKKVVTMASDRIRIRSSLAAGGSCKRSTTVGIERKAT
jgi:hypothetical protein